MGRSDNIVIANGTGVAVRTALNTAFSSLETDAWDDISFNSFRVFKSLVTSNTTLTLTADYCPYTKAPISLTVSTASAGAGGLDIGSIAASAWYAVYIIYNPTTQTVAGLLSTSFTSPTLPSNYTRYIKVGAAITNSSGYLYRIAQYGNEANYIIDGTILTSYPLLAQGVHQQTAVIISVSNYMAASIYALKVFLAASEATAWVALRTNLNQGTSYTNPPAAYIGVYGMSMVVPYTIYLEPDNIYYSSNADSGKAFLVGWEYNL